MSLPELTKEFPRQRPSLLAMRSVFMLVVIVEAKPCAQLIASDSSSKRTPFARVLVPNSTIRSESLTGLRLPEFCRGKRT
jgi:hypothetical protein